MLRVSALLLVALCSAAGAASGSSTTGAASTPTSFTDPAGDAGTAPDLTSVSVSSDANNQLTFLVNYAATPANTTATDIYIDADRNGSTGDPQEAGADWDLYQDWSQRGWDVEQWNGTSWVQASSTATVSVGTNAAGNELSFSINASEIGGGTSGFNFWVDSYDGQGGTGHDDQAPNAGLWSFTPSVSTAPLQLTVAKFVAPKTVVAGKLYEAGMIVQRSDTGDFLGTEGTVRCHARAAGKVVPATPTIVSLTLSGTKVSALFCVMTAPRKARGKLLTGTISATYQGVTTTRGFSAKIK